MSEQEMSVRYRSTGETFLWVLFLLYLTAGSSGGVWFLIDRISDW